MNQREPARHKYQLSTVGRFMLDERLIPLLEEKLKQLRSTLTVFTNNKP